MNIPKFIKLGATYVAVEQIIRVETEGTGALTVHLSEGQPSISTAPKSKEHELLQRFLDANLIS